MRRIVSALLFIVLAVLAASPSPAGAETPAKPSPLVGRPGPSLVAFSDYAVYADAVASGVTVARLRAEWQRVAVCEVGGNWAMTGPRYSGIGILNTTWYEYGGRRFAPLAGEATENEQIVIGMRVTRGWVPDQEGCSPTGW